MHHNSQHIVAMATDIQIWGSNSSMLLQFPGTIAHCPSAPSSPTFPHTHTHPPTHNIPMHARTPMHMHAQAHTHTRTGTHTHAQAHTHTHTHTHTQAHKHTHTHTHAHTHTHTHTLKEEVEAWESPERDRIDPCLRMELEDNPNLFSIKNRYTRREEYMMNNIPHKHHPQSQVVSLRKGRREPGNICISSLMSCDLYLWLILKSKLQPWLSSNFSLRLTSFSSTCHVI